MEEISENKIRLTTEDGKIVFFNIHKIGDTYMLTSVVMNENAIILNPNPDWIDLTNKQADTLGKIFNIIKGD